jgi:hypothetical protein
MTTRKRLPLWKAMYRAYDMSIVPDTLANSSSQDDSIYDRYGYAAELRAIADAIRDNDDLYDSSAVDVALWLREQANRAEVSE